MTAATLETKSEWQLPYSQQTTHPPGYDPKRRCPNFAFAVWALAALLWSIMVLPLVSLGTICILVFYAPCGKAKRPLDRLWSFLCHPPQALDNWMERQGWVQYE